MHFACTSNDKKQLSPIKMKENEESQKMREGEKKSIVVLFERHTSIKPNKYALFACLQSNSSN